MSDSAVSAPITPVTVQASPAGMVRSRSNPRTVLAPHRVEREVDAEELLDLSDRAGGLDVEPVGRHRAGGDPGALEPPLHRGDRGRGRSEPGSDLIRAEVLAIGRAGGIGHRLRRGLGAGVVAEGEVDPELDGVRRPRVGDPCIGVGPRGLRSGDGGPGGLGRRRWAEGEGAGAERQHRRDGDSDSSHAVGNLSFRAPRTWNEHSGTVVQSAYACARRQVGHDAMPCQHRDPDPRPADRDRPDLRMGACGTHAGAAPGTSRPALTTPGEPM